MASYGVAGVAAYGIFNTLYYITAVCTFWFFVPTGDAATLSAASGTEKLAKVFAATWVLSQATKLPRVAACVAASRLLWFRVCEHEAMVQSHPCCRPCFTANQQACLRMQPLCHASAHVCLPALTYLRFDHGAYTCGVTLPSCLTVLVDLLPASSSIAMTGAAFLADLLCLLRLSTGCWRSLLLPLPASPSSRCGIQYPGLCCPHACALHTGYLHEMIPHGTEIVSLSSTCAPFYLTVSVGTLHAS